MDTKKPRARKHLCMPGLLSRVRYSFDKIKDSVNRKVTISLSDCLMSGLAMFSLKYPPLLQFDRDCNEVERVKHNLKTLYKIEQTPSDTYMRERLDEVEPRYLQKTLDRLVSQLQRGKVLEHYRYFDDYCLVSLDATGCFSSHEIHCESCCVKKHKNGSFTYYHQMLAAVMMHPDYTTVFPLMLEPIQKQDGKRKNDCEHNAAKRLLRNLRNSHPHLKMIIVLDRLYAEGGRARWKIENETFNTLKNQGYQFEHNFGHGNKNLSTLFAYLMFIAFLIDQIQQYCCKYFKAAFKKIRYANEFVANTTYVLFILFH